MVDDEGDTLLMMAVRAGRIDLVKRLMGLGVRADTRNKRGLRRRCAPAS